MRSGCAGEAVGPVQHVKYGRDDRRAGDHADDQRHLLLPRRRVHQLSGLQVLQVVVGDRRGGEHHRRHQQRVGDQAICRRCRDTSAGRPNTSIRPKPMTARMPMPRQRAVRGADQAGHVAADRGHQKAHERDVEHAVRPPGKPGDRRARCRARTAPAARPRAARTAARPGPRGRSGCPARCAAAAPHCPAARAREATMAERRPASHRLHQLRQRPHGGYADGARADEAHLVAPGRARGHRVAAAARFAAGPRTAPRSAARPRPRR